jgi:hypothetical protein
MQASSTPMTAKQNSMPKRHRQPLCSWRATIPATCAERISDQDSRPGRPCVRSALKSTPNKSRRQFVHGFPGRPCMNQNPRWVPLLRATGVGDLVEEDARTQLPTSRRALERKEWQWHVIQLSDFRVQMPSLRGYSWRSTICSEFPTQICEGPHSVRLSGIGEA